MAFIVEDGTGVEDANAGVSVEYVDEYCADRAMTEWTGDTATKRSAIIRATDYIENRFSFKGEPYSEDQGLHYPISDSYDADEDDETDEPAEMPENYLKAIAEYSVRALSGPLAPDPVVSDTGLQVSSKMEKVGPLEESTTYTTSQARVIRAYPAADMLLRDLVKSTGNSVIR
jgi:hypothetical protein